MNLQKIIFFGIVMLFFSACGSGSSKNSVNYQNSDTTHQASEEYSKGNNLFLSKKSVIIEYYTNGSLYSRGISTCIFKYNKQNMLIEQESTTYDDNKTKLLNHRISRLNYDNQNRYIGYEYTLEGFISEQSKRVERGSSEIKYENDKIVEQNSYHDGELLRKIVTTQWDGNHPIEQEIISYHEGEERVRVRQINTFDGENIVHIEEYDNHGGIFILDRVFDDKKTSCGGHKEQKTYYTKDWTGKNNVIEETEIYSTDSSSITRYMQNSLKYNSHDMPIEKITMNYYIEEDGTRTLFSKIQTTNEYEER